MYKQTETSSMPQRDPSTWQSLLNAISQVWPQAYAALMAVVVSFVRGMQAGGKWRKNLLESVLCMSLVLAIIPVLEHFGLSSKLAVAFGVIIGWLGTEWIRERATVLADAFLSRWKR